jgi:hypothetical protein
MEQSNDESVSRTDVNTEYEYWEVEVPDTDSNRVHYLNAAAKFGWRLVHSGKYPCLVNTIGVMLKATGGKGGNGLPTQHFGEVVGLFDQINRELYSAGANTWPTLVSPLSADIFLSHFPDMEAWKDERYIMSKQIDAPFMEPNDDELAAEIASLFTDGPACEITIADDVHLDVLLNSDLVPENVVLGNFNRSPE